MNTPANPRSVTRLMLTMVVGFSAHLAHADAIFVGSTSPDSDVHAGPRWTYFNGDYRPWRSGAANELAIPYSLQPFHVTADGAYYLEAIGFDTVAMIFGPDGFDGTVTDGVDEPLAFDHDTGPEAFLMLPADLFNSRIDGGQPDDLGTHNSGLNLQAGVQYYALVTGHDNTAYGDYTAYLGSVIPGQGEVVLGEVVPEPSAAAITLAALFATFQRRRRRVG